MTTTTITNFRKNIFDFVNSAIEFNDVIDITTKNGNAVVMSKEDYNAMVETFNLLSIPGMREKIAEAMTTPETELVPLDEVEW